MKNCTIFKLLILSLVAKAIYLPSVAARSDWQSFTLDNDIFIGNDSGYTNGLYYSWYQTGVRDRPVDTGWLAKSLSWALPENKSNYSLNAFTVGQTMITPSDITLVVPDENDIPYSGLLYLNNTYLAINDAYADKISTTLGIIGPSSGAQAVQEVFHTLFDSDEPRGWDTQLHDELVFQFSRGRAWRTWHADSGHLDFVSGGEINVGTLESSVSAGMMFRYGRNMDQSFAVPLLTSARTTNPVAVEGSWYFYAGLNLSYIGNLIFADGNTFRDSRQVAYDPFKLGAAFGIAYSWQDFSVTFAINDIDLNGLNSSDNIGELTRYGTLTFVWRS